MRFGNIQNESPLCSDRNKVCHSQHACNDKVAASLELIMKSMEKEDKKEH